MDILPSMMPGNTPTTAAAFKRFLHVICCFMVYLVVANENCWFQCRYLCLILFRLSLTPILRTTQVCRVWSIVQSVFSQHYKSAYRRLRDHPEFCIRWALPGQTGLIRDVRSDNRILNSGHRSNDDPSACRIDIDIRRWETLSGPWAKENYRRIHQPRQRKDDWYAWACTEFACSAYSVQYTEFAHFPESSWRHVDHSDIGRNVQCRDLVEKYSRSFRYLFIHLI